MSKTTLTPEQIAERKARDKKRFSKTFAMLHLDYADDELREAKKYRPADDKRELFETRIKHAMKIISDLYDDVEAGMFE